MQKKRIIITQKIRVYIEKAFLSAIHLYVYVYLYSLKWFDSTAKDSQKQFHEGHDNIWEWQQRNGQWTEVTAN